MGWRKPSAGGNVGPSPSSEIMRPVGGTIQLYIAISLMVYDFIAYHRHIGLLLLCWLNDLNEIITHRAPITKTMVCVDFIKNGAKISFAYCRLCQNSTWYSDNNIKDIFFTVLKLIKYQWMLQTAICIKFTYKPCMTVIEK